jgi:hypothetical protein
MNGVVVNGRPVPVHCFCLAGMEECLWVRPGNWGDSLVGGGDWVQITRGRVRGC